MLLHYLGKLKIQIFCRYSADMEGNANRLNFKCTNFNSSARVTVYAECIDVLTEYLKYLSIQRHSCFLQCRHCEVCCFLAACQLCLCPSAFSTCFVRLFSGNWSVDLFAVYPFKYLLFIKILSPSLNTMLIIADKHCSDVCCDEFPVPQIHKSKYGK